jgi:uncharacterized protein (DUF952 family)
MAIIYHITTPAAWEQAQADGRYRADSLASEGFIHASTAQQVVAVANHLYSGRTDLVLLAIDEERLNVELKYEESVPGQFFPHIYGPLNLDAVLEVRPFSPGDDGVFAFGVR